MATVENEKNAGLAKDGGMDSSYESHGKIVDIEAHTGQPGGARSEGDTTIVNDNEELPNHHPALPRNWPRRRKTTIAVLVSLCQLVTLMTASVMAAALSTIAHDLKSSPSVTQITFTVYFLGLALGPLPIASFSERYGRKPVWIACNLWYCLWNALCPVGNSIGLMTAGRFLAGAGASVGLALSGPIVADMFGPEERGRSLAVATFAPYLGTALGPILGGVMAGNARWQWLFWTISIFDACLVIVAWFLLHETYAPVLRHRLIARQTPGSEKETQSADLATMQPPLHQKPKLDLKRPIQVLLRRPVAQVLAFLLGLNFGTYCITLSTFATLWIETYHQSPLTSSLHYIAIAAGATISTQLGGRLMDYVWKWLAFRSKTEPTPEFRVPMMVLGAFLMPIGIVWYGWAAERRSSWVLVDFGVGIFSIGSFVWAQAALAYLLDEFTDHAASANAACRLLSNIMGFAFPIFAPQLYQTLGYGRGNTLLAGLVVLLGWPSTLAMWKFGPGLRSIGRQE